MMRNSYIINTVLDELAPAEPERAALRLRLERALSDVAAVVWTGDDVREVAERNRRPLSDDEVAEVLDLIVFKHDAEVGVNWETIESHIDYLED